MQSEAYQFTPAEAAALAEINEKQVRKEIEYHVIEAGSPPRLSFSDLAYLYLVRRSSFSLGVKERSVVYRRLAGALANEETPEEIEVFDPFYLRLGSKLAHFRDRVAAFLRWKEALAYDPCVMGGTPTFAGTRLTVRKIGEALERGVSLQELQEDYPYLKEQDFEFSRVFVRAYPALGRPSDGDLV